MFNNKVKTSLFYLIIVLTGILLAISLYFYQVFYKSDHFLPGVYVNEVSIEGLTVEAATNKLATIMDDFLIAPVSFVYDDYQYQTTLDYLCNPPAIREFLEEVWQEEHQWPLYPKLLNMDGSRKVVYPFKLDYDAEKLDDMVKLWEANLAVDYVNARVEIDRNRGLVVIPSQPGKTVDVEKTLAILPRELNFNPRPNLVNIPIIMQEKNPAVNDEDLLDMGELAVFSTWYNPGEVDRTHNLTKATDSIDGTIIPPGEKFSFNSVVGPRTYATGYRDALVIMGGVFEPGLGGGICQVSSTLYNAVLLAGLDIVERHNHSLAVAYIPLGQDATVAYGIQDFKFRNNTDYPLYISTSVAGGKLTATIYGNIQYKQKIAVSNVVDKVTAFAEVRKPDHTLAVGQERIETNGIPGYVVRSFRTFYDQDGQVIKTEGLATDRYIPLNKLILVGPDVNGGNTELPKDNQVEDDEVKPNPNPNGSQDDIIEGGIGDQIDDKIDDINGGIINHGDDNSEPIITDDLLSD